MQKNSSRSLASLGEKLQRDGSLSFLNIQGATFNSRGDYGLLGQTRVFCQVMKEVHSGKENICSASMCYFLSGFLYKFFFSFIIGISDMYLVQHL